MRCDNLKARCSCVTPGAGSSFEAETRGAGGGATMENACISFIMRTITFYCGAGKYKAVQSCRSRLSLCKHGASQTVILRVRLLYRDQLSRLHFRWLPLSLIETAAQWPGLAPGQLHEMKAINLSLIAQFVSACSSVLTSASMHASA